MINIKNTSISSNEGYTGGFLFGNTVQFKISTTNITYNKAL